MPDKCTLAIVFVLFLCLSPCVGWGKTNDGSLFQEKFSEIMQCIADKKHNEALKLLNEVIDKEPDTATPLQLRSTLFLELGDVPRALGDLENLLRITPEDYELRVTRCVIKESQIQDRREARGCYATVAKSMQEQYTAEQLAHDKNYFMAAILAELPNAEDIRQKFLKNLSAANKSEAHDEELIRSFSPHTLAPFVEAIRKAQATAQQK